MALTAVDWGGLVAAFPADVYLMMRSEDPGSIRRAAVGGTTWSTRTRSQYWESDWVMMFSHSSDASVRARESAEHLQWHRSFEDGIEIGGITFTDDTELPSECIAVQSNAWSWFWTDESRARVGPDGEVITVDHHDPRLLQLLTHSETASHERDGKVPDKWFGYVLDGELVCVAAVNVTNGATYLQSVVTHTEHRGNGFAKRVCSHATWWSLQHFAFATLGMMSDNAVARRLYENLGYTCDKMFRSVRFASPTSSTDNLMSLAKPTSGPCGD